VRDGALRVIPQIPRAPWQMALNRPDHNPGAQRGENHLSPLTMRQLIDNDPVLTRLFDDVRTRFEADAAHDIAHLLRVADWTVRLLPGSEPRIAIAAALLHDVVNVPKDHADRVVASERSADVARAMLPPLGFGMETTELIADAVLDHSFTRGAVPRSELGKALQDADRLEALGAIGIFRCIATGVRFGAQFFDDADPWATKRPLDDKRFSVDHFFVKLFRLPATFQTIAGRQEAERRARIMHALLDSLGEELRENLSRN